ncbi:50S ribosomal protein L3 [candidate division WWE3 bacterium RBG_13_37_7]|uniref:Large ribosomal subunit protein uL3 n=1 Tax=candidate division WWE3 bacterium RBG_13_37_7 TaxID=1802609 RepID=A0A1F4U0I3_UNCKA|nr:MAG: 50S ribosomal protein L3 [candidate division WWE3 bacterium RBG_13_37_7]
MNNLVLKGKKLNMSQIFSDLGKVVPVTIVSISDEISDELMNKEVVVVGTSKGKGFTGGMKKWNFSGQQTTRGQSNKPRSQGSIGSQTPGRVYRGKKMPGRHGNAQITIKGLKIVGVMSEKKELLVSGPVPGARNSKLSIKVL